MSARNRLWYLSLVVAAYMIGISNLWKFPALILKYGLGGLLSYLFMVILMIPLISAAMESTKKKRHELVEYYEREFNTPGPAVAFFLFDILLLSYYSIASGWFLKTMGPSGVLPPEGWSIVTLLVFFSLLTLILLKGGNRTLDLMVVSLLLAFASLSLAIWAVYTKTESAGLMATVEAQLRQVLIWKGITGQMAVDMAKQAAYSVGIGMGFYALLGSFLPDEMGSVKIATVGAFLDTAAAFMGVVLMTTVLTVSSNPPSQGVEIIVSTLPTTLKRMNMTVPFYFLYSAFFFAALSSMIPLGELVARVTMELSTMPKNPRRFPEFRKRSVTRIMTLTLFIGLSMVAAGEYTGIDIISIFDETVETFILFGAILEVLAVIYRKEYIPNVLRNLSYPGILILGILGTEAVWETVKKENPVPLIILLIVLGIALLPKEYWTKHLKG